MPLSFERRWSLDRRKDDKKEDKKDDKKDDKSKDKEKKSKKEKKKYKTKLEEQMAHQIEELNRQIIEERQNTRREKLSVARLQRELAKAKSEGTMKETTMRELMQEREARTCLEEQLEGAVAENKSCNAQLEALQEEIMRLRSASSVDSLCDNAESCKRLQNGLSSTDTGLSDVERENCNVVVSNKQLELKVVSKEEVVREKSVLLERLRQLESENSALVLENENQRGTYDQCLDEVANQVVQALLMQKDLRDECLKLHGRVRDLELQNRNLRCLFDQNRFKPTIPSPLQSSSHQQYGSYSGTSPGLAGCSIPVLTPSASTHSSPSPASPGLYAPFTHPLRTKHQQSEPGPTGSTPDSGKDPPLSPHLLQGQSVKKLDHSGSPVKSSDQSKETNPHCDSYQRLVRQQYQQYRHHHSQQQLQQQRTLPQEIFRQLSAPANYPAPSSPHQAMQQGRTPGHRGLDQMYPFLPYQCEVQGVEGAGEGMGMEDYSWTTSPPDAFPSSIGHSSLPNTPGRMGVHDETLNGNLPFNGSLGARIAKMQVMGEDRLGRNSPPEVPDGRNGYILGDQYTKPYVHAPFHYAQSLLKELQEISASVKSFESLTLEPKANHQQKRKANDGQPVLQRQKLAKNFSPSASNASSESLNSATSPRHLNLMDSTSSVTSTESMETTLERIPPTVLSHSSPLRQEHHLQWRPEYGGNKVPDRTSPFPPDTPSPPTTDIEPSERDYQHSRYLRSRQHSGGTHHPEREHEIDSKVDVVSSVGRGNVNKAIDRYQEKVKNSTNGRRDNAQLPAKNQVPVLSMRDKDAINEAQRNLQISQENEMACGRVSHLPVRDDGKQGAYSVQNSSITRSKFGGVTAQVQNSSTGYSAEKTKSDEDVLESVTSAAQVKPKLSRQQAAESVNQNLEILPGEGSKHLCQKTAKSQPVNSLALPQLRDNDPNDTSGPIWKRKSQMEEYRLDVNEKRGEGKEEVDENEGTDSRVASFMTAPDGKVKEQDGKLLSKYENRTNGEVSPKHFAGKIQSPKSCRKSSLPFPIPSALTLATSKPSGAGLSQSVGSIAKADVGIVDEMKSAQSGDAVLERLETNKAVMSDESSTTEGTKDASATKPVLSTGEVEARRDEGSKSSVKVQGNVAGGEKIRQQIPVRTSREATESLLQKTKMQFNRGEVGRCSLGAKMMQLSKIGAPSPADRPLQSHHSTGRGPLAMAASSKAIDVPVLDSSPRLPGRRQMTPEHLRSGRDALGDMVEFTSQSIEERASVQSMSTESLQSANSLGSSADWDSPSKNSSTSKQPSASSLGNLLSSDSESEEEESVNFVDMWKARSTPPIKLPDWDPNKSIEEHRKRVRESLERSESASSASSEQWILSYPLPEDPLARGGRSSTTGPSSRQSSVGSMTRQDSSHSRSGVSCDEDRKILQELLEKERKAQSRSNSSDSSPEGRKENQQVVGSNLSLGEKSIMCDFMSSIMAEVKLEDTQQGGKSKSKGSKDDLTRPKKLSSPFIRSQSMRAPPKPSRPERTRIPSGGNMDNRKVNTNIPKPQAANSKSIASAKKIDTTSTKSPKTFQQNHSSNESKKNGSGLTRTFMPKAFTKTANKAASDSPNMNPSRSGVASPAASEKSGGKTKKSNLKNGKGKGKGNECTKSTNVGAKDPESGNKESKSKSKIPQLIRQGFKPSPWKGDSSKKKGTPRKEMVVESPKTSPAGSEMLRTETPSDSNKSAFTEVFPLTKQSSFIVDNVPFMDDSSKSPNKDENPNQTPSPNDEKNPFTSHLDQRGEALCGQSPKLSPRLLQRLRANGIELANSSGSDNDSVFLPDEPRPSTLQVDPALPCQMSNGSVTRHCQQTERTENGSTSELHLDQKEIEDIKNGLLVSESDALSIGSWSAKSSEFGLKNSFLFGNGDFGNVGTPTSRSLGRGSLGRESLGRESIGRGSLAPSVSSNPEDATGGVRAADDEVDPKKYDVPLVSTDMMEDFEAEDLCDEDGMSSDREKEAQLTEKERANLLDSLFESDDSEGGLDGFLDESSESLLDSHPDEKEFMKLLGDKGMKRQVVRQSVYCRVSLIQMDVFSLYNRFDDQEKEALACFDFLEEMYMNNAGETLFTDDHPFSVISPGVRSGNSESFGDSGGIVDQFGSKGTIKECFDTSLMQAGDTTSSLFGDDPSEATLVGESFTSKGSIGDGLNVNSEPSSGDFSEHFDGDSFSSRHSNKVFDGCYAIGDFSDHLGNRSNLCSSMSSSSTASLSSHE